MLDGTSSLVRRSDYAAPPFWIREVELDFDLDLATTRVTCRMRIERNALLPPHDSLRLQGEGLTLLDVRIGERQAQHHVSGGELSIDGLPAGDSFTVEVVTLCTPEANTSLRGLYVSGGGLFTQCEAEGFRRITYFLDRPDVMAVFTVTLRADKTRFPVLLSNGNLVESGDIGQGRHKVRWHDPFPKPSYLFALVAGTLSVREERFRSASGREHAVQVYARQEDIAQTKHAMDVLMASMAWDEARWGLALDLDRFMLVAVSDFNAGAMENKGLNIFNTKFVLADPGNATDEDFAGVDSVVSHEYFHNWTGNRITCRDWFQLSLKEGLTVYREQEFLADQAASASARAVRRIQDVRTLRATQFPEDAGTMAHPVRPDSYVRIDNFYTPTVYKKGAEVVRMMEALVGTAGFRRGMDRYVRRHDGQAVTCDDFARAMADANLDSPLARHFDAFMRWYSQAGTPRVQARGHHDPDDASYTLHLSQGAGASREPEAAQPFVIPLRTALLRADGTPIALRLDGESKAGPRERVLVLTEREQAFRFLDVAAEPVPSLLRGFSAPVTLDDGLGDEALLFMLEHDDDAFNRCEAAQRLGMRRLLATASSEGVDIDDLTPLEAGFIDALRKVLRDPDLDASFKELVLTLPAEGLIAEQDAVFDPRRIHVARESLRRKMARCLVDDWARAWHAHRCDEPYRTDPVQVGRRALSNLAMRHLVLAERGDRAADWSKRALALVDRPMPMTERFGALEALVDARAPSAAEALQRFHTEFRDRPLVVDKWFALQARAPEPVDGLPGTTLQEVESLLQHRDFSLKNPNRARSAIATFCQNNPGAFHLRDGSGYAFWVRQVRDLDRVNPSVASRLARSLDRWNALAPPWRANARAALAELAGTDGLSGEVREVIDRALAAAGL